MGMLICNILWNSCWFGVNFVLRCRCGELLGCNQRKTRPSGGVLSLLDITDPKVDAVNLYQRLNAREETASDLVYSARSHEYGLRSYTKFFTSRSARSARTAGTKIALRFSRLFVCLFLCLSVCAFALITCAIYDVIRYYATAVYSSFWRFAGQAASYSKWR